MNVLDYQRDDESATECLERFARITDHIDGDELAQWFDERVANSPRTFHPTSHDVMREAAASANLSALIRSFREADDWDEPLGPVDRDVQGSLVEHQEIQRGEVD